MFRLFGDCVPQRTSIQGILQETDQHQKDSLRKLNSLHLPKLWKHEQAITQTFTIEYSKKTTTIHFSEKQERTVKDQPFHWVLMLQGQTREHTTVYETRQNGQWSQVGLWTAWHQWVDVWHTTVMKLHSVDLLLYSGIQADGDTQSIATQSQARLGHTDNQSHDSTRHTNQSTPQFYENKKKFIENL